jgi:dTDP-4-amino-4,6-dideoxygalactose transaminase
MYYILVRDQEMQRRILAALNAQGIQAVFHYVPLHSSPAGQRYARSHGALHVTDDVSRTLIRLPLWVGLQESDIDTISAAILRELDV